MKSPNTKRTPDMYHGGAVSLHGAAPAGGAPGGEHVPPPPSPPGGTAGQPPGFSALEALAIYGAVFSLLLVAALALHAVQPTGASLAGIAAAQIIIGGVPAALAAARHRRGFVRALGLTRPTRWTLVGGLLCGSSVWYLNWQLVTPLGHWLFGDGDQLRHLEEAVTRAPLPWVLAAASLAPALCEEILLRGVVLRALRPGLGSAPAALLSAVLFSLLHLNTVQLLPTFAFGLVLGYAALRASLWVCVAMHFLNNAIALSLATGRLDGAGQWLAENLALAVPTAAILCIAGIAMMHLRPDR